MSIFNWIKLLSTLTDSEKDYLSLFCQEKHLNAGEILFKEKDDASAMYILKTWNIEVLREVKWEKVVLWKVHAEEILGEMALFNNTNKRMATAVWLTECDLIVILSFSIKELTLKHPELGEKITNIINNRIIQNRNCELICE